MAPDPELSAELVREYIEASRTETARLIRIDEQLTNVRQEVNGLTSALSTYAKSEEVAQTIQETAVTKEEDTQRRRRLFWTVSIVGLVLLAIFAGIGIALGIAIHSSNRVSSVVDQNQSRSVTLCAQRNITTQQQYDYAVGLYNTNLATRQTDEQLRSALQGVAKSASDPAFLNLLIRAFAPPPPIAPPEQPKLPNCNLLAK